MKKYDGTLIGASAVGILSVLALAGAAKIMYFGNPHTNSTLPWAHPTTVTRPTACNLGDCNQAAPQ